MGCIDITQFPSQQLAKRCFSGEHGSNLQGGGVACKSRLKRKPWVGGAAGKDESVRMGFKGAHALCGDVMAQPLSPNSWTFKDGLQYVY